MCGSNWLPKGTLLRSWLTKSRPRLLLFIAGLKRPQVTLMRRKRMKRTKIAKATVSSRSPHFSEEVLAKSRGASCGWHTWRREN
ncbi:hypothetical protein XELAEV_18026444mg [Xenopus laevis]|uniref:Uncharacterized protein n=1 Tax=Xenopus laevis TaxID=8355 RepID=A0A974HJC8_XENLA|nr:hypothetical protein XELAEV_18026444mg [Xenopus laevis]